MASILTNYGAMVALQNLQATQMALTNTQNEISTGLKVASAKDDASTWAISTVMKSNVANLQQVSTNLGNADSLLSTAVAGSNTITSLISQIGTQITNAQDGTSSASAVQNNITQLLAQINSTVTSSTFNGINLLDGSTTSQNILASVNSTTGGGSTPSYITVAGMNLGTSGLLTALGNIDVNYTANSNVSPTSLTLSIGQTSLAVGDSFAFNYTNAAGSAGTVTLVASNDASGTVESNTNGNYVVAVNTADANTSAAGTAAGVANYLTLVLTAGAAGTPSANSSNYAGGWTTTSSSVGTTAGVTPAIADTATPFDTYATAGEAGGLITLATGTGTAAPSVGTFKGGFSAMLATVAAAQADVIAASAQFGSAQNRVETQQTFVNNLVTTLQAGIGNMIDADMSTESARLTALQVQQQLGTQALSIANQAPQSILSLFK